MILKSYEAENNPNFYIESKNVLFYGENLGLKNEFKTEIRKKNNKCSFLNFSQEEIINNENLLINEISNASLFSENKIIFIENSTDKILKILEKINLELYTDHRIILFSEVLDKKSKLRNYFEKSNNLFTIACYKDNELSIKNLIIKSLKGYSGITTEVINLLIKNSNLDRVIIKNELSKIITFFSDKIIKTDDLEKLINIETNQDFNLLKDTVLKGSKTSTNKLLSNTIFEIEKMPLYINILNQRINKLLELSIFTKKEPITNAINKIRPPIFWKDKTDFLAQAKIWNENKLREAQKKTYELETKIKTDNFVNKNILLKKLLLDICALANS